MDEVLIRPKQKVLQGVKNTKDWKHNNIRYWGSKCNATFFNFKDMLVLFKTAAGILDESDYTYITNPLNTTDPKLKGYPAKMRNLDIVSPNIMMLMGELIDRFFNPVVVILNSDVKNQKLEKDYEIIKNYLKQEFINGLVSDGLLPQEQAVEQSQQKLEKELSKDYKNELAIIGQNALEYIMSFNEVLRIRRKTFYDFIVCSRFFTYRDICNEDLDYEYVSPFELSYLASPNVDFVEDAQAVRKRVKMTINQIIDKFREHPDFTKEIIDDLELNISSIGGAGFSLNAPDLTQQFNSVFLTNNLHSSTDGTGVEHIQWTSMKLMKKVEGTNIDGSKYIEEYDESYIPLEGEKVTDIWVNSKHEGYIINDKWVLGGEALEYQRGNINNPSKCKNSYNGRIFGNNYVIPQSIVQKGLIYQIKYNTVHYLMEKTLAKNKDKITIFPMGLVPEKEGFDMFTTMYYADAHGFLFIDETSEKAIAALQYMKVLDMSLGNYIQQSYQILQQIKQDWDDSVGVNRQRKGAMLASDGKGVSEQAEYRSAVMSEEFFMQHEEAIIKDIQCLVDLSKVAWQHGKKASFLNSNSKEVMLEIDPTVYSGLDLGVFVKNSKKEQQKIQAFQSQVGTIAQQTQNFSMLGKILDSTNMAELIKDMEELENKLNEQQQAQQETENKLEAARLESEEKDRQLKVYEIDENNERARDTALISAQASLLGSQEGVEGVDDAMLLEDMNHKRLELASKIGIEREKILESKNKRIDDNKNKAEDRKIDIKNMANDLAIAKQNKIGRNKPTSKK
jgi:hypothetical protein